jgi:hypothetical protein
MNPCSRQMMTLTLGRVAIGRTSVVAIRVACPSGQAFARVASNLVGTPSTLATGSTAALIQISALKSEV